ncbi:transcription initiation factor IIB related protein [Thermoplasma acidophilum]|uniref:Transcription initiation factor IIB n=1 Tax=Thermoplasma acidophilum (strain ATCC 25905 / DSM 1728 / JCM 9062 / NBRC 15155 / AMRC-C165) TaxID=273075 RepID=Q9HJE9_THEAC|nr:transcription initiation factor IIB family protein [Thermoplasma acidophilum]MCY0851752.1 transcription initiation factor IIB family protein [Thermoplasma acidophilum]CAC12149.1 transcription initiation factor IIB related protein [Thermoplasma acidophilum]
MERPETDLDRDELVSSFLGRLKRYKGLRIPENISKDENLNRIAPYLKRSGLMADLPENVIVDALKLYLESSSRGVSRGRGCVAVLAACLLIASRRQANPMTLKYIARSMHTDPSRVWRTENAIVKNMKTPSISARPMDFVERYSELLNVDNDVRSEAIALVQQFSREMRIMRKAPSTIAISAIYLASERLSKHLVQRYVVKKTGITEVTLIKTYKEMAEYLSMGTADT